MINVLSDLYSNGRMVVCVCVSYMLERASGQGSILAVPCQQPLTDTPY